MRRKGKGEGGEGRSDWECRPWRSTCDPSLGGTDAWTALSLGRLRHLEGLGLATRQERRYRLDGELELLLRTLQLRRDVIRSLNQRRLEAGSDVRPLAQGAVRGRVVKTGFHDEAGTAPWVIVRDAVGLEHYGRLRTGAARLELGKTVVLAPTGAGLAQVVQGRGADLVR